MYGDELDLRNLIGGADQPRDTRQALEAARHAANAGPAEVVKALFMVCALQQQQIEALELAVGALDAAETDNIRARARRLKEARDRGLMTGGV
jgi:hypothetical protein